MSGSSTMLALSYASAKETADRIAGRNRKCQKEWRHLFAEVAFCEVMRNQFGLLQGVECDELREQAKSKNSFVAFMQNENNKEFVSYYIYREYTVLFDKMKERRPDDFTGLDESDPEAMVKDIVKILTRLGFNGVSESNKLLRTPEEEVDAEASAVARREGNAVAKRVKMEMASKQLAEMAPKMNGADKSNQEAADPPLEEEATLRDADAAEAEAAPPNKRGRPKKPTKKTDGDGDQDDDGDNGDDIIARLVNEMDPDSEDSDDEGVEETKESDTVDETPKKKRGRPSKRKPLVSGDGDEVAQTESAPESATESATDEVTVLRARVKQLEDFIVGLGKKVPPMPLMDAKKAEDIVVSEGFEGLENDPVLSDDDSEDVIEFTHDGVKYYKDSNNNLYAFGCDLDNAEPVGTWNEEKNCVEEADSSDEDSSDEDTSDEE